ncbi:hypothetical protein JCM3770_001244 [Rhodotorula araucariae]
MPASASQIYSDLVGISQRLGTFLSEGDFDYPDGQARFADQSILPCALITAELRTRGPPSNLGRAIRRFAGIEPEQFNLSAHGQRFYREAGDLDEFHKYFHTATKGQARLVDAEIPIAKAIVERFVSVGLFDFDEFKQYMEKNDAEDADEYYAVQLSLALIVFYTCRNQVGMLIEPMIAATTSDDCFSGNYRRGTKLKIGPNDDDVSDPAYIIPRFKSTAARLGMSEAEMEAALSLLRVGLPRHRTSWTDNEKRAMDFLRAFWVDGARAGRVAANLGNVSIRVQTLLIHRWQRTLPPASAQTAAPAAAPVAAPAVGPIQQPDQRKIKDFFHAAAREGDNSNWSPGHESDKDEPGRAFKPIKRKYEILEDDDEDDEISMVDKGISSEGTDKAAAIGSAGNFLDRFSDDEDEDEVVVGPVASTTAVGRV